MGLLNRAGWAAALMLVSGAAMAAPAETWVGAWGHSPTAFNMTPPTTGANGRVSRPGYAALPPYNNVTVREVTRIAAAASRIRIRFTNEFGTGALAIGAAHVALAGDNGAIIPGSDHVVTFSGKSAVEFRKARPCCPIRSTGSCPPSPIWR